MQLLLRPRAFVSTCHNERGKFRRHGLRTPDHALRLNELALTDLAEFIIACPTQLTQSVLIHLGVLLVFFFRFESSRRRGSRMLLAVERVHSWRFSPGPIATSKTSPTTCLRHSLAISACEHESMRNKPRRDRQLRQPNPWQLKPKWLSSQNGFQDKMASANKNDASRWQGDSSRDFCRSYAQRMQTWSK